jgi:hypothetical protein
MPPGASAPGKVLSYEVPMSRGVIAALAGLLAGATVALGQPPSAEAPAEVLPPSAEPGPLPPVAGPGCADGGCNAYNVAPDCRVITLGVDYALWLIPERRQPFRVATTTSGGLTGTFTLGTEHLEDHLQSGARFWAGYYLAEPDPWMPGGNIPYLGVEASGFFMAPRSFRAIDNTSATISRPFVSLSALTESSVPVAAPGLATGAITAGAKQSIWGAEADVWSNVYRNSPGTTCTVDVMAGARFIGLDGSADVGSFTAFAARLTDFPAFAPFAGSQVVRQESFTSHSRFYGGQVGVRGRADLETMVISGHAQLGLGVTDEEVTIRGTSVRTTPAGATIVSPGALLALPGNIGRFDRDKFAQVPEFGVDIDFPIGDHLTLGLGLTALYWSRVARLEDQLSQAVDVTQIPNLPGGGGAAIVNHVGVALRQSDFWLLGALARVEVRW